MRMSRSPVATPHPYGNSAPGSSLGATAFYHVAIPRLMAGNQRHSYAAGPGALGQALREAGLLAAVVGNADDVHGRHREAACIAMDALGRVPLDRLAVPSLAPTPGTRRLHHRCPRGDRCHPRRDSREAPG